MLRWIGFECCSGAISRAAIARYIHMRLCKHICDFKLFVFLAMICKILKLLEYFFQLQIKIKWKMIHPSP